MALLCRLRLALLVAALCCDRLVWAGVISAGEHGAGPEALLSADLSDETLLKHHEYGGDLRPAAAAATGVDRRAAAVLAYITPWNSRGYDLAKQHRCKLDYVAPVWYQLRSSSGVLQLTGGHDVDAGWVAAVRQPCDDSTSVGSDGAQGDNGSNGSNGSGGSGGGNGAKVLPRVIFELQGQEVMEAFQQQQAVAQLLAREAQRHGFDGWVFEGWSYWAALGITQHPQMRPVALSLLRLVAAQLAEAGRQLVVVISPPVPAPGRPAQATLQDAEELLHFVDALSVMTYDHASPQKPGPNAPLPWVKQNAEALAAVADRLPGKPRHKLLLGLPFYGQEYRYRGKQLVGADAVLGSRLLEVLRQQQADGRQEADAAAEASSSGSDEEEQQLRQRQCSEIEEDGAGSCTAGSAASRSSSGGSGGGALRVQWLDESREHLFRWKEPVQQAGGSSGGGKKVKGKKKQKAVQHLLYYPTPLAVAERLAAAADLGLGAAIWELGQGLDAFCALL